ncbi:DUF3649 domain-containing protein [Rodentibacter caecimuris]
MCLNWANSKRTTWQAWCGLLFPAGETMI